MHMFHASKLLTLVVVTTPSANQTQFRFGGYGRRHSSMVPIVFLIAIYALLFFNYILAMSRVARVGGFLCMPEETCRVQQCNDLIARTTYTSA